MVMVRMGTKDCIKEKEHFCDCILCDSNYEAKFDAEIIKRFSTSSLAHSKTCENTSCSG